MNTNIVTQRLAMADAPPHVLARIMPVLMAAALAGGLLTTDAQARGGGGHVGGFDGRFASARGGGFGGMHMGGGFGGARIGSHFGGTHMGSGFGRGFHGDHRHGGYGPGYAYGYDYDWGCSPYGSSWPNVCY
jgi:hypothetical protein